ncbi:IDEAL domain-containing protein [Priestia endophytica]|uniref:IDEAL domain-containing protein n=2 Tax=Priestia endophytica TaxID=135735 RepID=A0A1I6AT11_9BACI|nr:IDEAL domain-containing protein [Priestia endophytica]SFQ71677.1 IDEAL domain-containing protein [Priestia endophytica DSM 13796]
MILIKNENSYTEMMKSLAHSRRNRKDENLLQMYIQMVIDDSLFKRKKEILETEINNALDTGDQQTFYKLADKYADLMKSTT